MDISLDHEKFEGIKELAAISTKIAEGRAALSKLKDETEMVLTERDAEFRNRLEITLVESEDLIRSIGTNHDDLVAYRRDIESYSVQLTEFLDKVITFRTASESFLKEALVILDDRLAVIRQISAQNHKEKLALDGLREGNDQRQDRLRDGERKLKDGEEKLARAWAELKTKK